MTTVDELEARDRLDEAAALAAKQGDHRNAARLWERACHFDRAALAALAAGEAARALDLAIRAAQPELERRACAELAKTPREAGLAAARLADQGRHPSAARVWLSLGEFAAAAAAFERGGSWLHAAEAHRAAGEPRRAARALEQALASDEASFEAHVLLGKLYVEHGRHDAAVRVLQKVPKQAPERARALAALVRALSALGLDDGVRDLEPELVALGVDRAPAPAPAAEPLPGAVLFGRYRVVADVARTPTARVVRAVDAIGGGEVAVKLFSAASLRDSGRDALARFEREAVALGKLRHPAIVPLHAYFPDGPAVVLEWMAGGSLADLLEADTISPARAAEIACAVLGALSEAHRRGILHRDIKPANVLFDAAGAAHLADFGAAHVADAAATVTSGVIGTLAYMAPEQRAGAPATARSDIYGVGALLWHALTDAAPADAQEFLSAELGAHERELSRRLIGPEALRPESALEARDLLLTARWPRTQPARRPISRAPTSRRLASADGRLTPIEGARFHDGWLGRDVLVLAASGADADRARAFARAAHPALASVLCVRQTDDTLWVEAVTGEPATPLGPEEHAELHAALTALHRAGARHGAVDAAHVLRRGGETVLAFPLEPRDAPADADFAHLDALCR